MPGNQDEDINQSAKQLGNNPREDARETETRKPQRPTQGIVKDQRGQEQPADKKRAQQNR